MQSLPKNRHAFQSRTNRVRCRSPAQRNSRSHEPCAPTALSSRSSPRSNARGRARRADRSNAAVVTRTRNVVDEIPRPELLEPALIFQGCRYRTKSLPLRLLRNRIRARPGSAPSRLDIRPARFTERPNRLPLVVRLNRHRPTRRLRARGSGPLRGRAAG